MSQPDDRDYHHLSRFEIDGAKRISQHLSEPQRSWPQFQCKLWKTRWLSPTSGTDFPHCRESVSRLHPSICSVFLGRGSWPIARAKKSALFFIHIEAIPLGAAGPPDSQVGTRIKVRMSTTPQMPAPPKPTTLEREYLPLLGSLVERD